MTTHMISDTTSAPTLTDDWEDTLEDTLNIEALEAEAQMLAEELAEELDEEHDDTVVKNTPTQGSSRIPVVAVVGRPNVGKSTLVNRIIGRRQAIVDNMPGVTRDRTYHQAKWSGQTITLMDTGGMMEAQSDTSPNADPFGNLINQQVDLALEECDVVVLVVDGIAGVHPLDELVAQRIRCSGKPVALAVNKMDRIEQHVHMYEFIQLGLDADPVPISALHGTAGVGHLLQQVIDYCDATDLSLPEQTGRSSPAASQMMARPMASRSSRKAEATAKSADLAILANDAPSLGDLPVKLALIGRPNVGKSSLLNALTQSRRAIVSPISGTTRDPLHEKLVWNDTTFILVDTAGIRKKKKVDYGVELFSVDRAIQTVRESDVTVLVVDAVEGLTDQDKLLINTSHDAGNGLILVINKWDLVENKGPNATRDMEKKLRFDIPHAHFAPMLFTSAESGQRVHKILELAKQVSENHRRRVATHLLNQVITEAMLITPPPHIKGKQLRVKYATQVQSAPPTFVLFVNSAKLMKETYQRYIEKQIRARFEFEGTPLRLILRERDKTHGK